MSWKNTLKMLCPRDLRSLEGEWSGDSEEDKTTPHCSFWNLPAIKDQGLPDVWEGILKRLREGTLRRFGKDRWRRRELIPHPAGTALSLHTELKYCSVNRWSANSCK